MSRITVTVPLHGSPVEVTGHYLDSLPGVATLALPTVGPGQSGDFFLAPGFDIRLHEVRPEDLVGKAGADDEHAHVSLAAAILDETLKSFRDPASVDLDEEARHFTALARAAWDQQDRESQVHWVLRQLRRGEAA